MANSTSHDLSSLSFIQPFLLNPSDDTLNTVANFATLRHDLLNHVFALLDFVLFLKGLLIITLLNDLSLLSA